VSIHTWKTIRGEIRYQVKVRDPEGQWFPTRSFLTKEEALKEEAALLGLKRAGRYSFSQDARRETVNSYWEVWGAQRRADTSEGWQISQNQMYRDYIAPVIGTVLMIDVCPPLIQEVLNRVKELGRGDQMRLHVYSLCHRMFEEAVQIYDMIPSNPVKPKYHRPVVKEKKPDFLSPAQSLALLDEARKHEYLGPAIWVQIYASLRCEAMMALDWASMSWDSNQILVRRAWKQKVGKMENYTKNGSWAITPLIPILKAYLRECWEKSGRAPDGYVCRGVKGGMLPYETYLRALRALCKKADVPVVTPHELRHSSTELWILAGATREDIARLLHHSSSETTGRYMHRSEARLMFIGQNVGQAIQESEHPKNVPINVPILEQRSVCREEESS
jgi:integrase